MLRFCTDVQVGAESELKLKTSVKWYVVGSHTKRIKGIVIERIRIHGQRIRFHGIDAPESRQLCRNLSDGKQWRCGQAAALALSDLIGRKTVSCTKKTKNRYGCIVAICSLQSINLNSWLVEHGWALDWPRYSKGQYNYYQETAKTNGSGVWSSEFDLPWEWRKNKH